MTPTPTKAQRLATQGDLDRCTAITVSQQSQIARLNEQVRRLQRVAARADDFAHAFVHNKATINEYTALMGALDALAPNDLELPVEGDTI